MIFTANIDYITNHAIDGKSIMQVNTSGFLNLKGSLFVSFTGITQCTMQ